MSQALQKTETGQVVPISEGVSLMATIARAATDPACDVEKMQRLLDMKLTLDAMQAEQAFNEAMAHVQAKMGRIGTDKHNKQTGSDYATYGKLDKVLRPLYSAEGFALSFGTDPSPTPDVLIVTCHVTHAGGHTRKYTIPMPADGKGAKGGDVMTKTHATGSASQYGMRYLLKMIFNVAIGDEDDDGNAAGLPRVTADQAATLRDMLEATGSDTTRFLAWLKVDSIDAIPAQAYDYALSALKAKERKA